MHLVPSRAQAVQSHLAPVGLAEFKVLPVPESLVDRLAGSDDDT